VSAEKHELPLPQGLNALVPHFTPFYSIYNHLSPLISLIPPFTGQIPPLVFWLLEKA
jgi:uncharacterized Tic20 family protein